MQPQLPIRRIRDRAFPARSLAKLRLAECNAAHRRYAPPHRQWDRHRPRLGRKARFEDGHLLPEKKIQIAQKSADRSGRLQYVRGGEPCCFQIGKPERHLAAALPPSRLQPCGDIHQH